MVTTTSNNSKLTDNFLRSVIRLARKALTEREWKLWRDPVVSGDTVSAAIVGEKPSDKSGVRDMAMGNIIVPKCDIEKGGYVKVTMTFNVYLDDIETTVSGVDYARGKDMTAYHNLVTGCMWLK